MGSHGLAPKEYQCEPVYGFTHVTRDADDYDELEIDSEELMVVYDREKQMDKRNRDEWIVVDPEISTSLEERL